MVKEWISKGQVVLVRNPAYNWAPALAQHQGPAHLDEIVWRFSGHRRDKGTIGEDPPSRLCVRPRLDDFSPPLYAMQLRYKRGANR